MNVILGATGVVGAAVLEELHERRLPVRAVSRARTPHLQGLEHVRVDLATGDGLAACLEGAESVFLVTGDMVDQVGAELRVIEAARHAGVRRLVKLSILGAESEAFYLARVHRAIEREVERSGLSFTLLRPGGFMQNFITYYGHSLRTEGVLRLPWRDEKEDPIDARDIARVAAVCLTSERFAGRALDLGGPQSLSYPERVRSLAQASGRTLTYETVSEAAYREAVLPYSVTPAHADGLIDMFRFHREGRAPSPRDHVLEVTGTPPRSFEAFAKEHADFWRGT
ncbi:NmrA family protein [Myxococcus stipitatus DSM 14675]|uniref:NmrA family protein n=1 Tax=Myxococcus stipitatus (strain DSM 14675 / JCM 12634 / Mx s8) TaxID=1278073 RepID=L7U7U2_MYXSD|nr:NAD(P)H-binding protein [Myxococcus stipitatus]AGC44188.1 NmrA family protein [Myxococcus stipitatus DSM 14675]